MGIIWSTNIMRIRTIHNRTQINKEKDLWVHRNQSVSKILMIAKVLLSTRVKSNCLCNNIRSRCCYKETIYKDSHYKVSKIRLRLVFLILIRDKDLIDEIA